MKHSSATRGGDLSYASPSLELLEISVEQGFNLSLGTGEQIGYDEEEEI